MEMWQRGSSWENLATLLFEVISQKCREQLANFGINMYNYKSWYFFLV